MDATRLKEPGGTGDDWRVHLGYDLLAGRLLDVKVSDQHTAEGFTLFGWQVGDIVVADRGYCRRRQLVFVLQAGAQVVVRLAVHQVPLLDEHGQPLDVLAWLKALEHGQQRCLVAFEHEGRCFAGRLIACSLPVEAAERARAKERKKAAKQQRQLKAETLYLCGWLLLFTSLPAHRWSDEQVLALYRARWQVELVIKRDARKCSGSPNCAARPLAPTRPPCWRCWWAGPYSSRQRSTPGKSSPRHSSSGRARRRLAPLSPTSQLRARRR